MDIKDLIADRTDQGTFRVHRSTMTSPEIHDLEYKHIFNKSWLYVGHESELERPGDYRRRTVARRPLVFLRNKQGEVRVLLNTCTHRGALVCRKDEGNANSFQCFYHAWTFNTDGELIGVPGSDGYPPDFDLSERNLQSPPRVESYAGMYFISFDPDIEELSVWLGPVAEYIDLTMDAADVVGGWTVLAGSAQYTIKANWKLLVENSIDSYHFATVHQTYNTYMAKRRAATGTTREKRKAGSLGIALPNGHGGFLHEAEGRPLASTSPLWSDEANTEVERLRSLLEERFGPERAQKMADGSRHLLVFPNLMFQDSSTGFRIRQIWPVGPDAMEVIQWELVPREEISELRSARLDSSAAFLGPGGFGTPDDIEALESCQTGFSVVEAPWSDISRGTHHDQPTSDEELQIRGFWREWASLMRPAALSDEATAFAD